MNHELHRENVERVNRRQLFGRSACGIGVAALSSLLNPGRTFGLADDRPQNLMSGLPGLPHHAAKAKRVIVFWQGGGPSHVDLALVLRLPRIILVQTFRESHELALERFDFA